MFRAGRVVLVYFAFAVGCGLGTGDVMVDGYDPADDFIDSNSEVGTIEEELTTSRSPMGDSSVISGNYANTNFGSREVLYADLAAPLQKHAYLEFAVPAGAITRARLRIF